jgi:hypothetical protein
LTVFVPFFESWALPEWLSTEAILGTCAFVLQLCGYVVYGRQVLAARVRPNVASWSMWLFGGVVEWLTYDAIAGAHWSSSALPLACTLGIAGVCTAAAVAARREKAQGRVPLYHRPERADWALFSFDVAAAALWLGGFGAALANSVAVLSSVVTFIPIWRTTYQHPASEEPLPWLLWCAAYACMLATVLVGQAAAPAVLLIYPLVYLALHGVVLALACRKPASALEQKQDDALA